MLVHNIHSTSVVLKKNINNIFPLVGHCLKQSIFPMLALIVDINPRVRDQIPHSGDIPVPDSVGEGGGAVVGGEVHINVASF